MGRGHGGGRGGNIYFFNGGFGRGGRVRGRGFHRGWYGGGGGFNEDDRIGENGQGRRGAQ